MYLNFQFLIQVKFHSSYPPVFFLPGLSFGGLFGGPLGSVIGKVYGYLLFGSGSGMPLGRTAGILSGITIGLGGAIVTPLIYQLDTNTGRATVETAKRL